MYGFHIFPTTYYLFSISLLRIVCKIRSNSLYSFNIQLLLQQSNKLITKPLTALSGDQLKDGDILVLQMDVLDYDSHKRHFDHAVRHFGTVDILINNAGRSQRALWEDIDLTVDRQMFDLNVFATLNLSRIAVRYFNTKGTGQIAVTSSVAGLIPAPFSATYIGSKFAIHVRLYLISILF